ncbi:MAG: hypothetical protein AAF658_05650 [Myxococcota bacterium]
MIRTAFIVSLLLMVARASAAGSEPRVALESTLSSSATESRVRAELMARGFNPVRLDPSVDLGSADLSRLADQLDVVGFFRLAPNERAVTIWSVNRATGKVVRRRIDVDSGEAQLLAHRAVETLRASLLEQRLAPIDAPNPTRIEISEETEPVPHSETEALSLRLGGAGLVAAGGVGPSFALDIQVTANLSKHFALGAHAMLPLATTSVSNPDASAELRFWSLSAQAAWHPIRRPFDLWLATRIGAQNVWSRGSVTGPGLGVTDTQWLTRADLELGAAFEVARGIAFYGAATAGTTLPRLAVRFGDVAVARWGQPIAGVMMGVRVGFSRAGSLF